MTTYSRCKHLIPINTRPNFKELARLGGYNARAVIMAKPAWERQAKSARSALARWRPDDPAMKLSWQDFKAAYYFAFKAGYEHGAGLKP